MGYTDMDTETEGNFLRIEAGKFIQFNILSPEPEKLKTHWINRKPTPCEGADCSQCASGHKPRKSWRIKVFDRASGLVKDFEFGASIANQIKNLAGILQENGQDIKDVDLRINRTGATLEDTEYFVTQLPKKPLPADLTGDGVPF